MKHFLDLHKTDSHDLRLILNQASQLKAKRRGLSKGTLDEERPLQDNIVALIFEKPSTRTRVSFDLGIRQMGGQTMVLSGTELQLGHGETIADTTRVLSRYVDMIMLRTFDESVLLEMADFSSVPVINGLTDRSHPCQVMADILTYEEHRGSIAGKKVVWLGDGSNVCTSLLHAATQFGFDFVFSGPANFNPDDDAIEFAHSRGSSVLIERDVKQAVIGADLVVTDTWVSMHYSQSSMERRHNLLRPYQVNNDLMKLANPDALFMHCLPAHRGEEVTSDVMDGVQSVVWDEAENRLHAQKAIMRWCMEK